MKLLLDQGMPRGSAVLLRELGFEAAHTAEMGLAEAEDEQILARAAKEDRIIITLDADFHARLAQGKSNKPSVVRIRIEGLRAKPLVELLQGVLDKCRDELELGAMVTVQENRIRVRRLPVT